MEMTLIDSRFREIEWYGMSNFVEVIQSKRLQDVSMDYIRSYYEWQNLELPDGNNLYTVRMYLSDLLSRRARLSKPQIEHLNKMFDEITIRMKHMRSRSK